MKVTIDLYYDYDEEDNEIEYYAISDLENNTLHDGFNSQYGAEKFAQQKGYEIVAI